MISAFYHRWHQHPRHPFWHWMFFSFFTAFIFTYLYTNILDYLNQEILFISIQTPQAQAAGNTYYVATTGNDANSGTLTQPFKTIVKGNSVLEPGDTLYIRGGTYDEAINKAQAKSGTASQPIIIAGYPGETALIYSFPLCFYNCAGASSGASYVILDNFIFDGVRYGTSGIYFGTGGNTYAPNHITLKNSTVRNHWGGQGIQVAGSYHTFSNLKVYNIGRDTFDHGFYIDSGSHVTVENSEVYNIQSAGIKFGETAMDSGIARNNIIHDFGLGQASTSASTQGGGVGIVMSVGTTNTLAYNNIIYNNRSPANCGNCPGFQLWKGNNNQIYNNVVYNMGTHQGMMVSYMTNVTVTNNIVVGSSPNFKNEGFGGTWTLSNNLCDISGVGCAIVGNPAFVNVGTNDFHLQSTSPAINTGATLSVVTTDFDGVSRPQGSAYDIGAYEYGGIVTVTPTPTSTPTPTPPLPAGCFTGTSSWQSHSITSQTGKFRAEFDAKPAANNLDGVIGLSQIAASAYTSLAVTVRFNNQGLIDARNGANYNALTSLPYTTGTNYHFRLEIDISSHTYSIYVTPAGGSEITLGTNYGFRTEQLSATGLNYWNVISGIGNTTICNFSISNVIASPTPSTSSGPSACDLNQDTKTDILDFQLLANVILGITPNPGGFDINKDGQVNILDTQVLANVILGKGSCL